MSSYSSQVFFPKLGIFGGGSWQLRDATASKIGQAGKIGVIEVNYYFTFSRITYFSLASNADTRTSAIFLFFPILTINLDDALPIRHFLNGSSPHDQSS